MQPAAARLAAPVRAAARRLRPAAVVALAALILMAVTALNGRPTVFSDTDDYFSQGRGVVRALERWVGDGKPPISLADARYRMTNPDGADEEPVHNQDAARSVYYGVLLYLCDAAGSIWVLAGVQALAAAALVRTLWRKALPGASERSYLAAMAVLALGSTLPVFTGFAMPDVFASFAAMVVVLVVGFADRFGAWGKAGLWLMLAACMNFHGSNLLTSVAVAVVGLAWVAWRGASWRSVAFRCGLVASAAAAAVLAGQAYGLAVKMRTGDTLGRPPFLTARVLADGPGREYLRDECGVPRFAVCADRGLRLTDIEDMLWSDDPAVGIYNSADFKTRERMDREDSRFALAAVLHDPLREAMAALRNWGELLVSAQLDEPLRDPGFYVADPYWRTTTLRGLTMDAGRCNPERGDCAIRAPRIAWARWCAAVEIVAVGALALMLAAALVRRRPPTPGAGRDAPFVASMLVLFVVANAAVCGMLSGVFARYETRVLWLLPLAALLMLNAWRRRSPPIAP